jgi:hypothetical protein
VRLFLRKSRVEDSCPVYTRSENAIARIKRLERGLMGDGVWQRFGTKWAIWCSVGRAGPFEGIAVVGLRWYPADLVTSESNVMAY